jgi:hypothetical protein
MLWVISLLVLAKSHWVADGFRLTYLLIKLQTRIFLLPFIALPLRVFAAGG